MKKALFLFSCLGILLSAGAQTVEEIIQKYTTAQGSLETFGKVKTVKMSGNFMMQGQSFPMTIRVINGKAVRSDIEINGTNIINTYKDGKGWKQNPFAGTPDPVDLTGDELLELKEQSLMSDMLADYKSRGHKVELDGQEEVNGVKAYRIKLARKDDGKLTTFFVSASDYALIKSVTDRDMMGQTVPVETWYSDFKDYNGAKVPMTLTIKMNGEEFSTIQFEKFETDIAIDEKIFDKP